MASADHIKFGSRPEWFCIRSQPKHEHIAATHLKKEEGIEVFLPLIRFKRSTRRGPVWSTEALFPNYLFARFVFPACARKLHHTRGVHGILHFGNQWPAIPDEVILQLQNTIGPHHIRVIESELQPGDAVQISGGPFHGLEAIVTRVMPAQKRVMLLLEFLGRQAIADMEVAALLRLSDVRRRII